MSDYELLNEDGLVIGGPLELIRSKVAELERASEGVDRHSRNEHWRQVRIAVEGFFAACREFDRLNDNLRSAYSSHDEVAERYRELRKHKFDPETTIEFRRALNEISEELTTHHGVVMRAHEAWHKACERVIAAVEKLDEFDAEDLREQDARIGEIPRYAVA